MTADYCNHCRSFACANCPRLKGREKLWLEYVQLLSTECNDLGVYQRIRGIECLEEKVKKGQEMRDKLGVEWDGKKIKFKDRAGVAQLD